MLDLNFAKESSTFIQKHVDLCMEKLTQYVDKGTFDFHSIIHKCMVDIIKGKPMNLAKSSCLQ